MKKRGLMFAFTSVFLVAMINLVSAQFYGGFSLSDILSSIDQSTMILGVIFVVSLAFINQALIRTIFRDNAAIAGIIAFAISLLIIYGINLTGLDFEGFFYNLGFSEGFLSTVVLLALIGGGIYLGIKYGLGEMLMVLGGFFIILSFTDFIYETATTFIIGLIFLGIGGWLLSKKKRGIGGSYSPPERFRGIDYGQEASRLRDKQKYDYYKRVEEQREGQAFKQRRNQERESRKSQIEEKKLRDRYARRYGKGAARKRFGA